MKPFLCHVRRRVTSLRLVFCYPLSCSPCHLSHGVRNLLTKAKNNNAQSYSYTLWAGQHAWQEADIYVKKAEFKTWKDGEPCGKNS